MTVCRSLVRLLPVLMLGTMFAATSKINIQITVLKTESYSLDSGTPVPKDCDLQNYSAYCNESKNPTVQNVMKVRDDEGKSYSIACTLDSRWSNCAALPTGNTFEARREKHGITVFYLDAKGKEKKQLYQLVAGQGDQSGAAAVPAPTKHASSATVTPTSAQVQSTLAPRVPSQSSSVAVTSAPVSAEARSSQKVRCNFSSTPGGADITVDGSYVGNTPSEIGLTIGRHVVQIAKVGFDAWQRDLTVAPDSAVNVTANLQKTQP